jgi:hypothetical protein
MSKTTVSGSDDIPSAASTPTKLPDIKSLTRKPGDTIRSEDWNRLVTELVALREYVNNMGESMTLTGLTSASGAAFDIDTDSPPGYGYGARAVGLITKQWVAPLPANTGEVCSFGVTDYFETLQFWAGADNGDKPTLDIVFEYIDGTTYKAGDKLFINNKSVLTARDPANSNPYFEFLKAPLGIWYKYQVRNKSPDKEVRSIKFINVNKECVLRIGNVLHMRAKIKPMT